jgi:hypothetical protein
MDEVQKQFYLFIQQPSSEPTVIVFVPFSVVENRREMWKLLFLLCCNRDTIMIHLYNYNFSFQNR